MSVPDVINLSRNAPVICNRDFPPVAEKGERNRLPSIIDGFEGLFFFVVDGP